MQSVNNMVPQFNVSFVFKWLVEHNAFVRIHVTIDAVQRGIPLTARD